MWFRTITLVIYVIIFIMFWHNGVDNILHNNLLLLAFREFDALNFSLSSCMFDCHIQNFSYDEKKVR